jgi:hypothetical protein
MIDQPPVPFSLAALVICPTVDTPGIAETLLSLAAQTNAEFEIHVIVAEGKPSEMTAMAELVGTFDDPFSSRVNLIDQSQIGSETPFGSGVARSGASYVAALYPDDVVFAHWAETIALHGRLVGGRALSSLVAVQTVEEAIWGDERIVTTVARPSVEGPTDFDLFAHLSSPPILLRGLALPRLTVQRVLVQGVPPVAEGWAIRLAVALSSGIVEIAEVTHLERVVPSADHASVDPSEWDRDRRLALEALGRSGLTFGADFLGSLWRPGRASLRELEAEVAQVRTRLRHVEEVGQAHAEAEIAARQHAAELLSSASWKASAPLRALSDAVRRRRGTPPPSP